MTNLTNLVGDIPSTMSTVRSAYNLKLDSIRKKFNYALAVLLKECNKSQLCSSLTYHAQCHNAFEYAFVLCCCESECIIWSGVPRFVFCSSNLTSLLCSVLEYDHKRWGLALTFRHIGNTHNQWPNVFWQHAVKYIGISKISTSTQRCGERRWLPLNNDTCKGLRRPGCWAAVS